MGCLIDFFHTLERFSSPPLLFSEGLFNLFYSKNFAYLKNVKLYQDYKNNKYLLYSTGNYMHYLVINYNGIK